VQLDGVVRNINIFGHFVTKIGQLFYSKIWSHCSCLSASKYLSPSFEWRKAFRGRRWGAVL